MELKARSIKLFCAVVETGSLLSAANQNAMSAPAASRGGEPARGQARLQALRPLDEEPDAHGGRQGALSRGEGVDARLAHARGLSEAEASTKKQLRIAVLARHCSNVIIPAVAKILKAHEETLRITMDVHQSRDIYYSKFSHPFDVGFGTLLSSHETCRRRRSRTCPSGWWFRRPIP